MSLVHNSINYIFVYVLPCKIKKKIQPQYLCIYNATSFQAIVLEVAEVIMC